MNVLDTIAAHKLKEVAERKQHTAIRELESRDLFSVRPISLKQRLVMENASGIIAEFKRKSPSKGIIHGTAEPDKTSLHYIQAGATGLSILTDQNFFGGSEADFLAVRRVNSTHPMLRKDFIIDEYQIVESKSIGADVILLIAAMLDAVTIKHFASLAHSLKMEVLLEVHNEEELLQNLNAGTDMIGVNNRNLKTFEVNIDLSKRLFPLIPSGTVKISESGIDRVQSIVELRKLGYQGFLMGQQFMEQPDPGSACIEFIQTLRKS